MTGRPDRFLWGVATSAHQVEGGTVGNDWAAAESAGRVPPVGRAVDHYTRFAEDLDLFRALGLNAYRFSVEWSRIEPEPGRYDVEALNHYRAVVAASRARDLTPLVTLYHFTLPRWLAAAGGWLAPDAVSRFGALTAVVADALSDVDWWCTVNEPTILAVMGYLRGEWPPFMRAPAKALAVLRRLRAAHRVARRELKARRPAARVGWAHHMMALRAARPHAADRLAAAVADRLFNWAPLDALAADSDYIGLNYYTPAYVSWRRPADPAFARPGDPVTDMGWSIDPRGLEELLLRLSRRYHKPVVVTENGIATTSDTLRRAFLAGHLAALRRARLAGVPVLGYFYWSGLDNYEWKEGFRPGFGLYAVDPVTLARRRKPGAEILEAWARAGVPENGPVTE